MFKSPRFIAILASLSVAGVALSAAPAAAGTGDAEFTFKVKVKEGQTVYCANRSGNSHRLPYQGCQSKHRWAMQGVTINDPAGILIAANTPQAPGKPAQRN